MIKLFLFFCMSFINVACAVDPQQVCAQANALYGKKEYVRARELYESIEPQSNSIVLYNIANCMYKQGDYMQAYIYWQRASQNAQAAIQADIAYNIAIVQEKIGVEPQQEIGVFAALKKNIAALPLLVLQLLFLCVWFMLTFYFIKMSIRGKKYKFVMGCLVLASGILVGTLMINYQSSTQRTAFVMHNEAMLFAGPHARYHQLSELKKTSRVTVMQVREGWAKVEHKNQVGWVATDSIAIV